MNCHNEMFAMLVETSHHAKFYVWCAVRGTRILHKFILICYHHVVIIGRKKQILIDTFCKLKYEVLNAYFWFNALWLAAQ